MTPNRPTVGERLYGLLLGLYPDAFLERFEGQMLEAFRRERRDPRYGGPLGAMRFWGMIVWDLARTLREARRRHVTRTKPEIGSAMGAAGAGRTGWEAVVDGVRQDLRFAVRTLLRAPGFALMAILTLAIGIGANAAVFSVVNSVLLKPLPYGQPDRVVTIWSQWRGFPKTWVSVAEYQAYVSMNRTMEDIALWGHGSVTFTSPENPERVGSASATPNLPSVLGVPMALGRFFTEEEGVHGNNNPSETVVLSNNAWVRRYASDSGVIGRLVEINGRDREVIGVFPEGFQLPTDFGSGAITDVYFPAWVPRDEPTSFPGGGGSHGFHMAGRLLPDVSVEEARADLHRIIHQIHAEFGAYPDEHAFNPLLYSAADDIVGDLRPAILALLGTVAFVLLIACANVASLLLTRSQIRHGELAVRAALGAGRGRIVRQMLTESLVLGLVGCGLGLLMAYGGVELFRELNPGNLPRVEEITVDGAVVGFSLFVTFATVLFFGGLPALRTVRSDLRSGLGQRNEGGVGRGGWQGTLVAAEMALAVVLVIGAGLMVRTFSKLSAVDTGFEGEGVLSLAVSLPTTSYPTAEDMVVFHNEAMRRIGELPGVQRVAGARILPLASQIGDWGLRIENYEAPPTLPVNGDWQFAAPGYFEVMGIPVVEGRTFTAQDDAKGMGVMVVNEAFVRHFWPEGTMGPIGRRVAMRTGAAEPTWMTVVGVVGDVTHNGITAEIKRKFYIPMAQWSMASGSRPTSMRYVVKTSGRPETMVASVRDVIRRLDPALAIAQIRTVREIKAAAVAQPRFTVVLMGAFSAIAVVLAMIGIYGVISYGVTQRFQEIGIRIALGAQREQVVGLMVRKGITMVGVGLAVGFGIALGMTRYLESLLYDVSATDPVTFAAVGVGFTAVAWLATWIPSRRAARVDPIRALKTE